MATMLELDTLSSTVSHFWISTRVIPLAGEAINTGSVSEKEVR